MSCKTPKKLHRDLGGAIQTVSPLLNLIPGAGPVLGPLAGILGGVISSRNQESIIPPVQQNTNPYGLANGGTIHIKPENKGKFTAAAKRAGMGVQAYAKKVLADPNASATLKKRANFARNAAKWHHADGGYLTNLSPLTQLVQGNNPNIIDGVELPTALVDHGETISATSEGQYVFSDRLRNPLTGNTFAKDDKRLALSDKKAFIKNNDREAINTLDVNNMIRENMRKLNEIGRIITEPSKKGMWNGGPLPWEGFDVGAFQKYASGKGFDFGKTGLDSKWGPTTEKAWNMYGPEYAPSVGYLYSEDDKSYLPASGYSSTTITPTVETLLSLQNLGQNIPQVRNIYQAEGGKVGDPIPEKILQSGYINPVVLGRTVTDPKKTGGEQYTDPKYPAGVSRWLGLTSPTKWNTRKGRYLDDKGGNKNFLGTALQIGELLGKGATLLRGVDKQKLYTNQAPIGLRQYDPAMAQMANQYDFNALKSTIGNTIGDSARQAQLQQVYSNKYKANAQIAAQFTDMNKQAQDRYEAALAQRATENNQSRYLTDDINARNEGAFFNALRGLFMDVGNIGRAKVSQDSNKQAVKWLLEAFPDLINTKLGKFLTKED